MTRQTFKKTRKEEKIQSSGSRAFFEVLFLKKTVVAHVWTSGPVATARLRRASPARASRVRDDDSYRETKEELVCYRSSDDGGVGASQILPETKLTATHR